MAANTSALIASFKEKKAVALVLGGTGAVGRALLRDLLALGAFEKVISVGRREVNTDGFVGTEALVQKVVNFDKLEDNRADFSGISHAFCCLGTTRGDAGSTAAFVRIDHDYVIASAKLIHEENALKTNEGDKSKATSSVHFLYCSSTGASTSSMFLYPQTKGRVEKDLTEIGFQRVTIARPGFLEIEQERTRPRGGESFFGKTLIPMIEFFAPKSASIPVATVARAMRTAAIVAALGQPDLPAAVRESKDNGTLLEIYNHQQLHTMGAPPS